MLKLKSLRRLRLTRLHLIALAALLVLGGGLAYANLGGWPAENSSQGAGSGETESGPGANKPYNLDPPTSTEVAETEDHKKTLTQSPPPPQQAPSGKKLVNPTISSVSSSEVNAYVAGTLEDGGTCKVTATKGSLVREGSSPGFANVSYTSCAPIQVSLPPGTWSVTIEYSSVTSEGKTTQTFKVS